MNDEWKFEDPSDLIVSEGKKRWFAFRVQPQQEFVVEANLHRQHFRTFIPRTIKTVKHARRIETRKASLFPGYGFVELDLERQRWRSINGTRGVLHLVMACEKPIAVPKGVIEELLESADSDGIVDLSRGLVIGSNVRLRAGPFVGAIGLLTDRDDKGRVEILLRMMNGEIRIKTAQELLEASSSSA